MVSKEQVKAAKDADDAALATLTAARAAKNDAQAALESARDGVRAAMPAYDATHIEWASLRRQYLEGKGAEAAQTLGGN